MRFSALFQKLLPGLPIILLFSCGTLDQHSVSGFSDSAPGVEAVGDPSPVREKVAEGAGLLVGKNRLIVHGRTFPMDCSGFVMATYYYAGIDLQREIQPYRGNGVSRIYALLKDQNLLHTGKDPRPGDIIFWDNTYDRNEDGKWNDYLTHTGIVIRASQWGTIDYAHVNYRRGIIIERMNLKEKDVQTKLINGEKIVINSFMRMKGEPGGGGNLSSHLFRAFGMGYELK